MFIIYKLEFNFQDEYGTLKLKHDNGCNHLLKETHIG